MSTCGTSFMKQTCPQAHASTSCPADKLLTDKLDTFAVTYLDTNNNAVSDPEQAERLKVVLTLKDRAYAEDIHSTSTITLRKLNQ
jgi:hypothetical protein